METIGQFITAMGTDEEILTARVKIKSIKDDDIVPYRYLGSLGNIPWGLFAHIWNEDLAAFYPEVDGDIIIKYGKGEHHGSRSIRKAP